MISVSIFLPFSILGGFLFPFEHDSLPPLFVVVASGGESVGESCQYNKCSSTTNASSFLPWPIFGVPLGLFSTILWL